MEKRALPHQGVGGLSIQTALCLCIFCTFLPGLTRAQSADLIASDFDGSGRVDFSDFLAFAGAFGKSAGQEGFDTKFDLDNSMVVDFGDFLVFAGNFSKSTSGETETFLYVADIFSDRVEVVNIATNLTIPSRAFSVPLPRGLAFGQQSALVYVANPDSLFAFTDTGQRSFAIQLTQVKNQGSGELRGPGGFKVAVNKDETLAFVSEDAGIVEVIDLVNRVSLEQIAVGNRPVGMVLSSDESELYIGRSGESIAVVNVAQRALVDSINVGIVGSGKLALADDGSTLYAAATKPDGAHTSGSLVQILAIDPAGRTLTDSVQTSKTGDFSGQVVDISVSSPAGKLLVSYQRTAPAELGNLTGFTLVGDLVVISLSSFAVTNEITIGEQAAGFGISPDGSTAYVSGSEDILAGLFRVFVVDLVAGRKLSQLPIAVQSGSEFVFTTAKQAVNTALSLIDLALFGN